MVVQRAADYSERRTDGYQVGPTCTRGLRCGLSNFGLPLSPPIKSAREARPAERYASLRHAPTLAACPPRPQEPELIYILGTSHLSLRSAEDVRLLLDAAHPEAVVVELCRSRAAQAYTEGGSGEEGAECEPGGSSGAHSSGEGEGRVSEGEQSGSRGAALPGKAANPLGMR